LSAEPLIAVEDLEHQYPGGVLALAGVSLHIEEGEAIGIIGQNGSGKTTFVKHLNGLLRPTRGRVLVAGQDTRKARTSRLARVVGYVFQNPDHQIFAGRVWDEVAFGPKNVGLQGAELEQAVGAALTTMGLTDLAGRHPYTLSRGQRQRLAIAAILAMRPRVLVLDEPMGGQDRTQVSRLLATLADLRASGHTTIMVSHDLEIIAAFCQRAVVFRAGRVLLDGPVRDVFARTDDLQQTFLKAPQIARFSLARGLPRVALTVDEACELLDGAADGTAANPPVREAPHPSTG
jgi:cobalt transport protein ATP-binding subunit